MLNKMKDWIFSKYTLIVIGALLLSLTIWFLGPYFGIGNNYPFKDVFVRIVLIIWCWVFLGFTFAKLPVSPLVFLLAMVVFWYFTPTLSFSEVRPFEPIWVRVTGLIIFTVAYTAYLVFLFIRALRRDPEFAEKILKSKSTLVDQERKVEQKLIAKLRPVERALKNSLSRLGFIKRIFTRRDAYLYHLPWYMVLGTPASGKTTLIANARIPFPIPEQTSQSAYYTSLQADVPKTDICQFWLTNDLLFVDVSGSFMDPPSQKSLEGSWGILLNLLRKVRAKHAVNGLILTVSAEELIHSTSSDLKLMTALFRMRLQELRKQLGIVFPVYIYITKMDVLPGFEAYFRSLTTEARDQVFGFTLPYQHQTPADLNDTLLDQEIQALSQRLDRGLITKLNEEMELEARRELTVFPTEFECFAGYLKEFVRQIFLDSGVEFSQEKEFLRGVYFVSAAQDLRKVSAIQDSISDQMALKDSYQPSSGKVERTANRSYFIHDALKKVILPESGLVRPNTGWELKSRLVRACVFTGIFAFLVWSSFGMYYSHQNNRMYLESIAHKAEDFRSYVSNYIEQPKTEKVPLVLNLASDLPKYIGWDMSSPDLKVRYGLYAAPSIMQASKTTYNQLLDHLLLSYIIQKIENALEKAIKDKDFQLASNLLSIYLMLHEKSNTYYQVEEIREWVLKDWSVNNWSSTFGNSSAMIAHIEALFDGTRYVKAASLQNDSMIQGARKFLSQKALPVRIYERMVTSIQPELPANFTLIQALGPQAGLIFKTASGESLEMGVPGLYTYDGYHSVFSNYLSKNVESSVLHDAWLMGFSEQESAASVKQSDSIVLEIRKLYLNNYALQWKNFLDNLDVVTGSSIAFDLNVLRDFSAPSSPLNRLAPILLQQITLSHPIASAGIVADALDGAKKPKAANAVQSLENYVFREEEKLERDLVDNHFVALREMITGVTDVKNTNDGDTAVTGMNLKYFASLIGEYYNYLSMTNTQLNTITIPEDSDINVRILLEASKMPAPFSRILNSFVDAGAEKISISKGEILRKYADVQMTELMTALNVGVTEVCDVAISGRYPFVDSNYEVSMDDFNKLFAASGVLDNYFNTRLLKYVDTAQRPWRYKSAQQVALQNVGTQEGGLAATGMTNIGTGFSPTLDSELAVLLSERGPDPELFAKAKDIQTAFFQEPGAQKLALQLTYKIVEMDSSILELVFNIDGQSRKYVHEATKDVTFTWPGNISGTHAEMIARPMVRLDTSSLRKEGAWALFRLVESGSMINSVNGNRKSVMFDFDGRKVVLDFGSNASISPFAIENLRQFSCPRIR